jgi:hypothetical protein
LSSKRSCMNKHRIRKTIVVLILSGFTLMCAWLGYELHDNYREDKRLKGDYFTVNQIKYGLLSGNNWAYQLNNIIAAKIDSFKVTGENKRVLRKQVEAVLHRMLDEANVMLHRKREKLGERIRFALISTFVNVEDFRSEVPRFASAIVDELARSQHKSNLKKMIKEKVSGFLESTNQDSTGIRERMLKIYNMPSLSDFNAHIERRVDEIRVQQRLRGFVMTGILLLILLTWIYIVRTKELYAVSFLISVIASFTALFIGVSLPMIEIDARISELDVKLLSSSIVFYDQVIFYQAKSILDVIRILVTHGHADTVFVGVLILLFSVLFPLTKLICTTVYLFSDKRTGKFVRYMAFNSAKWSMADVMVIAIFMAYVGFKSILDNQLADITMQTDTINVLTTNKTNLQTGFMVFVAFTLFNLMLGEILKRITRLPRDQSAEAVAPLTGAPATGERDGTD